MDLNVYNGYHDDGNSGYYAVRIGGYEYVVDTGSPVTFSYFGLDSLEIDGKRYPFRNDIEPPCSKMQLFWLTGKMMAGIIGLDVIRKTGLTVDFENRTLDFSVPEKEAEGPCVVLPFSVYSGQVLLTDAAALGSNEGERVLRNAIIDTGASVSYVSDECAGCLEETEDFIEDFSPLLGQHISGNYHEGDVLLPVDGGKHSRRVKLGIMPEELQNALKASLGRCDAVLGVSVLTDRRIVFDFSKMEIRASL